MKLYYGDGEVTIDTPNVACVEIVYTGNIIYRDKTPDGYAIAHSDRKIIIFTYGGKSELSRLFTYSGDLKVIQCKIATWDFEYRSIEITKTDNTSINSLQGAVEDLTIPVRKMVSIPGAGIKQTKSNKNYIGGLNTSTNRATLYFSDGIEYQGDFHIMTETGQVMTEAVPSKNSVPLSIEQKYNRRVIDKLREQAISKISGHGSKRGSY